MKEWFERICLVFLGGLFSFSLLNVDSFNGYWVAALSLLCAYVLIKYRYHKKRADLLIELTEDIKESMKGEEKLNATRNI